MGLCRGDPFFNQGLARIPVLLRLANRRGRFIKADGRFIKAASLNCNFFPTVAALSTPRAAVAGRSLDLEQGSQFLPFPVETGKTKFC